MEESAYGSSPRRGSYRDLVVWRKSMDLALDLHRTSLMLPGFERYELGRDQRRSSRSIASNVAEGWGRLSRPSYRWHVAIALGSQAELETQVELARRLKYLSEDVWNDHLAAIAEVGRMLNGLRRSLKRGE